MKALILALKRELDKIEKEKIRILISLTNLDERKKRLEDMFLSEEQENENGQDSLVER